MTTPNINASEKIFLEFRYNQYQEIVSTMYKVDLASKNSRNDEENILRNGHKKFEGILMGIV
jgi:hypothetical protein